MRDITKYCVICSLMTSYCGELNEEQVCESCSDMPEMDDQDGMEISTDFIIPLYQVAL